MWYVFASLCHYVNTIHIFAVIIYIFIYVKQKQKISKINLNGDILCNRRLFFPLKTEQKNVIFFIQKFTVEKRLQKF